MPRRLVLKAPCQLEWEEQPTPVLQEGHAVLRTRKTAVSVSSTLSEYLGNIPVDFPRPAGYESLAVVKETSNPYTFPVGTRVVDTYGHADLVLRPLHRLVAVPAAVPDEVALLSILACDAFKGVYRLKPRQDVKVLVMGAGVMGLLTIWNLVSLGIQVDVHDPRPERLRLAGLLGAQAAGLSNLNGKYRFGVECSGHREAFDLLQTAMLPGGKICVPSDGNWGELTLRREFHARELTIVGSSDGMRYPDHARIFFRQPPEMFAVWKQVYEWEIPPAALTDAFERMARGERPMKIMVDWTSEPPD